MPRRGKANWKPAMPDCMGDPPRRRECDAWCKVLLVAMGIIASLIFAYIAVAFFRPDLVRLH